jgi:rSAM/selenodomain-associated transferase 2
MNDGRISIIIPVLDNATLLAATLGSLQDLRQRDHEVLVVDGGSRDGSVTVARRLADRVLLSGPGRAQQMNAGAASASHEILLFLRADTHLPGNADTLIRGALAVPGQIWGRFDVRFGDTQVSSRLIERFINWRAAATGLVDGAQALFVERTWFERVGGYDPVPALEDRALSRKLKRHGWPGRITTPVRSARR